jgi:hypothetical protein
LTRTGTELVVVVGGVVVLVVAGVVVVAVAVAGAVPTVYSYGIAAHENHLMSSAASRFAA